MDSGIRFEPPAAWIDKTTIAYAAPDADPTTAANFAVTNETLADAASLRAHVKRQLLAAARQLRDFDLIERRDTTMGGLPAIYTRFSWTAPFGNVEQTMTSVERTVAGKRILTTLTTTAVSALADAIRPVFEEVLSTVRFEAEEPTRPAPTSAPRAAFESPFSFPMPGFPRTAGGA